MHGFFVCRAKLFITPAQPFLSFIETRLCIPGCTRKNLPLMLRRSLWQVTPHEWFDTCLATGLSSISK
jgi:hypothetical protein